MAPAPDKQSENLGHVQSAGSFTYCLWHALDTRESRLLLLTQEWGSIIKILPTYNAFSERRQPYSTEIACISLQFIWNFYLTVTQQHCLLLTFISHPYKLRAFNPPIDLVLPGNERPWTWPKYLHRCMGIMRIENVSTRATPTSRRSPTDRLPAAMWNAFTNSDYGDPQHTSPSY